jgi:hypothetical protein
MARTSWIAVWVVMLGGLSLGAVGCGGDGPAPAEDMGLGDSATGRCDTAADCPQSACTTVTCEASACVITPLSDGPAPPVAQTTGDCQQVTCLGGAVQSADDDTDLPAGNACATGTCDGGVAVVTPAPLGQACDENGGSVCNGDNVTPACVGCNAPADCTDLPEDDECQTRTCVEHVCGQEFTASGTALALQTPRDCEELQCDGAGGVMSGAARHRPAGRPQRLHRRHLQRGHPDSHHARHGQRVRRRHAELRRERAVRGLQHARRVRRRHLLRRQHVHRRRVRAHVRHARQRGPHRAPGAGRLPGADLRRRRRPRAHRGGHGPSRKTTATSAPRRRAWTARPCSRPR